MRINPVNLVAKNERNFLAMLTRNIAPSRLEPENTIAISAKCRSDTTNLPRLPRHKPFGAERDLGDFFARWRCREPRQPHLFDAKCGGAPQNRTDIMETADVVSDNNHTRSIETY